MISRLIGIRIFEVEASSRCNLSCQFCSRESLPSRGLMSEETFQSFLDHMPLGTRDTLSFIGLGEPLLNPSLPSFLSLAKKRYPNTSTWVTSNGVLLTRSLSRKLIEAGLDCLDISFNGTNAGTYERLTRGARFDDTLANIEGMRMEIERQKSPLKLQVNYILTRENLARRAKIQSFWKARGIERFREQWIHGRGNAEVPGMTSGDLPGLRGRTCNMFELMMFISWQGDVHFCSHDIHRRHVLGNVCRDSRAVIEKRRRSIVRRQKWPDMCQTCTDPQRHHSLIESLDKQVWQELSRRLVATWRVPLRRAK